MPDLSRLSKKFARQRARLQDVVSVYMAVKRLCVDVALSAPGMHLRVICNLTTPLARCPSRRRPDLIEHLQDFEGTHATLLHKQFLEDFTTLFEVSLSRNENFKTRVGGRTSLGLRVGPTHGRISTSRC